MYTASMLSPSTLPSERFPQLVLTELFISGMCRVSLSNSSKLTLSLRDKDAKHRLKGYPSVSGTIPATAFNRNGTIFAYAVSYDWSKGHAGNNPQYPNKVMLHPIKEDEAKPRPAAKKPR